MTDLVQTTIRLDPAVNEALATLAQAAGQETADYTADVLARHVMADLRKAAPDVAKRLQAEMEIKAEAVKVAREFVRNEPKRDHFDVTLRVFQAVRSNGRLDRAYREAIGGREPTERGNSRKGDLNRAIGAAIKTAVNARPRMKNGKPDKVQVSNEYIFSFTPLLVPKAA